LREWLVQQQTCPTCRADIAANKARRKKQLETEAAVAAAETEVVTTEIDGPCADIVAEAKEVVEVSNEAGESEKPEEKGKAVDSVNLEIKEGQTPNIRTGISAQADSGALIPGWVEEWDQVSNRTYYWKKDTAETSWRKPTVHTDVLSQFNALLHQHNVACDAQKHLREFLQRKQNEIAANAASHINHVPCLHCIKTPFGAPGLERYAATSKRVISQGKLIVCTSIEYWPEVGASMFSMPDGYVSSVDVEKFLELDPWSIVTNVQERGSGVPVDEA
jgi:hypothetical protein